MAIPKNEQFKHFMHKEKNVPLSVAFCCLIGWFLLSSVYFYLIEQGNEHQEWSFFEALYFFFISVATIGLGDYNVHDTRRTIVDYSFIIGGIALFSFCIRLFSQKLEHIDDEVIKSIIDEYRASLQTRYQAFDSEYHMQASENAQRKEIRRLIREKGGWMRIFIGKNVEAKMLMEYRRRANMRIKATQSQVTIRNVALDVKPDVADVQTMTGDSYIVHYLSAASSNDGKDKPETTVLSGQNPPEASEAKKATADDTKKPPAVARGAVTSRGGTGVFVARAARGRGYLRGRRS